MNLGWLPGDGEKRLDAALAYAREGWAIFPCHGKKPYTKDGFKAATSDPQQVAELWSRWPSANLGWPVADGLFALDVDPRHGGDGSLRELEREHSLLPFTLRAITGSGGEHIIFRCPVGIEIRQLAGFRPGLDTRVGGRGYLLIAPSIHPDTGKPYRWHTAVEPVDAPSWLVDLVRVPFVAPRPPYVPPSATRDMDRRRKYALAALRGCVEELRASGKGQRNDTLNRVWFRMAQLRDAIDRAEVEAAFLDVALAIGLTEREARQVMR